MLLPGFFQNSIQVCLSVAFSHSISLESKVWSHTHSDTVIVWTNSSFILSEKSDLYMVDNLSIAYLVAISGDLITVSLRKSSTTFLVFSQISCWILKRSLNSSNFESNIIRLKIFCCSQCGNCLWCHNKLQIANAYSTPTYLLLVIQFFAIFCDRISWLRLRFGLNSFISFAFSHYFFFVFE